LSGVVCNLTSTANRVQYTSLIEKDNISATEVSMNIENLVNNLESRKSEVFVTTDVKKQLKMLVDSGEINEAKFPKKFENFYKTILEYVNKWKCSLGNTEVQVDATKEDI
jgi:hypothetical protein